MEKLLFVDCCLRGREKSATYRVADTFLKTYREIHPQIQLEEVVLAEEKLLCYTGREIEQRDRLLGAGQLNAPAFRLARQFAQADRVLIAAPYWDLSFPAMLKAYIEHICVCGITFGYADGGAEVGLCRAQKLLLVTTSGGAFSEGEMWMRGTGCAYLKALCHMFGIPDFQSLWVQGLDIWGNDRQMLLQQGQSDARELAERW